MAPVDNSRTGATAHITLHAHHPIETGPDMTKPSSPHPKAHWSDPAPPTFAEPQPYDPSALNEEEAKTARENWKLSKCTWCGGLHMRACPRVKRFVFSGDGKTVVEVEFWPEAQWAATGAGIVWPEEMRWEEDDASPFAVDQPPATG